MAKIKNNTCKKCGAQIGAFVKYCGETQNDPQTKGVCLKSSSK